MNNYENQIMVSVMCIAYNHEKYIRKALEGLYMQETTFPVEFIVHDDVSTDGTLSIIKEYLEKDPERFILIAEKENQYSKRVNFIEEKMVPMARGKYIAYLECDDFWTDPHKLQKQVDALEAHPECSMCTHLVKGVSEDEKKTLLMFPEKAFSEGVVPAEEVIHRVLGECEWLFHTTSYMLRMEVLREAYEKKYEFFIHYLYEDHALILLGAMKGDFYYLEESMSIYRISSIGAATTREKNRTNRAAAAKRALHYVEAYDVQTEGRFSKDVVPYRRFYEFMLADSTGDYNTLRKPEMKELYRKLQWYSKIRIGIASVFPGFDQFYYRFRKIVKGY